MPLKTIESMERGDIFSYVGIQSGVAFKGAFVGFDNRWIYCHTYILKNHMVDISMFSTVLLRQKRICRDCILYATCIKELSTIECAMEKGLLI